MATRIKGILFDLGDTLLDFGKVDIPSVFEAGARAAYAYLKDMGQTLPSFAKYHRQQLWAIRWSYLRSRMTRREFSALDLLGRLSARMGHDLTPRQTDELAWLWYEPLSRCATCEDGLGRMLAEFQQDGLVLGIVSNTFVPGQVLDRHLEREGLLRLLPVRIYSCDVLYRKPNPKIFQIALQRAGLRAEETLLVGDSPEADIRGANRAGMISVLKDTAGKYDRAFTGACYHIRQLGELRKLVRDAGGG